jgi:hypothetical protein
LAQPDHEGSQQIQEDLSQSVPANEFEPGNDWIAIRYNTMTDRAKLDMTAHTEFLIGGYYGISMFTRPNMTAREVAIAVAPNTNVVQGRMRAVRIGALRDAGFEVVDYVEATGHVTVRFAAKPDDALWDRLIALMGAPEPVPFVNLEV